MLDVEGLAEKPGLLLTVCLHSTAGVGAVEHDLRDPRTEACCDPAWRDAGILDGIVKQAGNGLLLVAAVSPDQRADGDQVRDEGHGFALAPLAAVQFGSPAEGVCVALVVDQGVACVELAHQITLGWGYAPCDPLKVIVAPSRLLLRWHQQGDSQPTRSPIAPQAL